MCWTVSICRDCEGSKKDSGILLTPGAGNDPTTPAELALPSSAINEMRTALNDLFLAAMDAGNDRGSCRGSMFCRFEERCEKSRHKQNNKPKNEFHCGRSM